VENFNNLKVYREAFALTKDVFRCMEGKRMSWRAREQLLAAVSSICANLAEMAAHDSVSAKRQKAVICVGEANETEFWLDLCHSLGIIQNEEHARFTSSLSRIRSMLCALIKTMN